MHNKNTLIRCTMICTVIFVTCATTFISTSSAYWIWTPETKKFINPKYAVKDSPKEQYDWAMSFYDAKEYQRAAAEFDKLTKHYEYSEYAAKAQYQAGLSYENLGKYYIAFQNYQKAIDNFPHIGNIDEIIAREFNIGNIYADKENPKVLGADILTSTDRAIEIFKNVVDNAPFGKLADEAQYRMGEVLKEAQRYDEATVAFQRLVDDYQTSKFADKAKYEVAYCAYMASLQPAYDAAPTDRAIKAFKEFTEEHKDSELTKEADKTIQRLKDKSAEKSMMTARFYESQKRYPSAIIYYQDVMTRFPDSSQAPEARAKIEELKAGKKAPSADAIGKSWIPSWFGKKKQEAKKEEIITPEIAAEEPAAPEAVPASAPVEEAAPKAVMLPAPEAAPAAPPVAPAPQAVETAPETKVEEAAPPAEKTVAVEPAQETEKEAAPPAKKGWMPLSFGKRPEKEPTAVPAAEEKIEEPAKKGWFPFSLGKKKEAEKAAVVEPVQEAEKQATKPAKKGWTPLSFGKKSENSVEEPLDVEPVQETEKAGQPAKKGWTPLNFD